MRRILAVLLIVLPSSWKRRLGNWFLGWDVHPTAHIGPSVILVTKLVMGPGASIGRFNVVRGLEELRLGEGAFITTRNWITGFKPGTPSFQHSPNRRSCLIMGDHSGITIGHDFDCSDRVEIGSYSGFIGFRSTVMTHSLDLVRDRFLTGPVVLADYSVVMSGCTLLSGARVPARSIISAGSVVTTKLAQELTVYRGNPAEPVRTLPESLGLFHRHETGANPYLGIAGTKPGTRAQPPAAGAPSRPDSGAGGETA